MVNTDTHRGFTGDFHRHIYLAYLTFFCMMAVATPLSLEPLSLSGPAETEHGVHINGKLVPSSIYVNTTLSDAIQQAPPDSVVTLGTRTYTGAGNVNITLGMHALTLTGLGPLAHATLDCGRDSKFNYLFNITGPPYHCMSRGAQGRCHQIFSSYRPLITLKHITITNCARAIIANRTRVLLHDVTVVGNEQALGATWSDVTVNTSLIVNNSLSSSIPYRGIVSLLGCNGTFVDSVYQNNSRFGERDTLCNLMIVPEGNNQILFQRTELLDNGWFSTITWNDPDGRKHEQARNGTGEPPSLPSLVGIVCIAVVHKVPGWSIEMESSQFIRNRAVGAGSVVFLSQIAIPGCDKEECRILYKNVSFANNYGEFGVVQMTQEAYQVVLFTAYPSIFVRNGQFLNNSASYGGAIVSRGANPYISNCRFEYNHLVPTLVSNVIQLGWNLLLDGRGGASSGAARVVDCIVHDQHSSQRTIDNPASSIAILGTSAVTFLNCTFILENGNFLYVEPLEVIFESSNFQFGPGSFRGIRAMESASPIFRNSTFNAHADSVHLHGGGKRLTLPDYVFGVSLLFLSSGLSSPVLENLDITISGAASLLGCEGTSNPRISSSVVRGRDAAFIASSFCEGKKGVEFTSCEFSGSFEYAAPFLLKYARQTEFTDCHFHNISVTNTLPEVTPAIIDTVSNLITDIDVEAAGTITLHNSLFDDNYVLPMWVAGHLDVTKTIFRHNFAGTPMFILHPGAQLSLNRSALCEPVSSTVHTPLLECGNASSHAGDEPTVFGCFATSAKHLDGCRVANRECSIGLNSRDSIFLCANEPFVTKLILGTRTVEFVMSIFSDNPLAQVSVVLARTDSPAHAIVSSGKGSFSHNLTYSSPLFERGGRYEVKLTADHPSNLSISTQSQDASVCEYASTLSTPERFLGMSTVFTLRKLSFVAVLKDQFGDRLLAQEWPHLYLEARERGSDHVIRVNTSRALLDAEFQVDFPDVGTWDLFVHALPSGPPELENLNRPLLTVRMIWQGWVFVGVGVIVLIITAAIAYCISRTWRAKAAKLHDALLEKDILLEDATRGGPAEMQARYLARFEQSEHPAVVVLDPDFHLHVLCEAPGYWHRVDEHSGYSIDTSYLSPEVTSAFHDLQAVLKDSNVTIPSDLEWIPFDRLPPALYDTDTPSSAFVEIFLKISVCSADKYYLRHRHEGLNHAVLPSGQTLWVCDHHLATRPELRRKHPFDLVPGVRHMMSPVSGSDGFVEVEIPSPGNIPPSSPAYTIVSLICRELARTKSGRQMTMTRLRLMQSKALEAVFRDRLQLLISGDRDQLARPWPDRAQAERRVIMDEVNRHTRRFKTGDDGVDKANLDFVWHGAMDGELALRNICRLGFLNLARLNTGYHGRGAYFTHDPEYAEYYGSSGGHRPVPTEFGEGVLLLSWALLGQVYPVVERMDRTSDPEHVFHSGYPGHDSHAALVQPGGLPCLDYEQRAFTYDEVVIWQENQVLPFCIVYYRTEPSGSN